MLYSKMMIPTIKEVPADAEIPSHQLMIRAGLIRKLASGTYTYLPAGLRILKKIMNIVRQEMDKCDAQEVLLPSVQPMELWQKTGRDTDYGQTMAKFEDRHGRLNVLAPTAEEVMTHVVSGQINSYKQLPVNLYQISFKFRDEFRPRFGVLRSREFLMKDSYSFHANLECLDETYWQMYNAYKKIFSRCGVPYVVVEAETGEMGGSGSHQFTVPCENGEDVIVYTEDSEYAANIEKADVDALVAEPKDENAPAMEEVATPNVKTIDDLCEFFKIESKGFIKTLIYTLGAKKNKTMAILLRGDHELNPEKLAQLFGGAHVDLAEDNTVIEVTGAKVGFAGPIGLDKVNIIVVDHAVATMAIGIVGANKTDCHIKNVVPGRDFPLDETVKIADVRNAIDGDTKDGKKLLFKRGIEVGQVFKLGSKYSKKLEAKFLDKNGKSSPFIMGCYGIGINRIMASAIETSYDKNGIIWPISIAPFEVIVTTVGEDEILATTAKEIHDELEKAHLEVLYDDRDVRGGVKFKDADLLGIPVRITVGKKSVADGNVELKIRANQDNELVAINDAVEKVIGIVKELKDALNVEA